MYVPRSEYSSTCSQTINQQYTPGPVAGQINESTICHNDDENVLSTEENKNETTTPGVLCNETTNTISLETTESILQVLQQTTQPDTSPTVHHSHCDRSSVSGLQGGFKSSSHLTRLGPSPLDDSSNSGEAFVPEGAREVTQGQESPSVSPPFQDGTLPAAVPGQLQVVFVREERVPCHVTTTFGDSPPSYEQVIGSQTLTNAVQPQEEILRNNDLMADREAYDRKERRVLKIGLGLVLLVLIVIIGVTTT